VAPLRSVAREAEEVVLLLRRSGPEEAEALLPRWPEREAEEAVVVLPPWREGLSGFRSRGPEPRPVAWRPGWHRRLKCYVGLSWFRWVPPEVGFCPLNEESRMINRFSNAILRLGNLLSSGESKIVR
jgi:hypothetical protein